MLNGIYNAGSGISAAEQRQQAVAENIANLDMPGFRKMYARLEQIPASGSSLEPASRGVVVNSMVRDFQPGAVEVTDRPLDVSIDGEGFFVVEGPRGPLYTRNGVMQVDANGQLVTNSGFPYRGVDPLPADVAVEDVFVQPDGTLWAGDQPLGKLEVAQFENPQELQPVGIVYFEAPEGVESQPSNAFVKQGQREGSNVNASEELVQMIVGLRHHEASQRALRTISEAIAEHTKGR